MKQRVSLSKCTCTLRRSCAYHVQIHKNARIVRRLDEIDVAMMQPLKLRKFYIKR